MLIQIPTPFKRYLHYRAVEHNQVILCLPCYTVYVDRGTVKNRVLNSYLTGYSDNKTLESCPSPGSCFCLQIALSVKPPPSFYVTLLQKKEGEQIS